MLHSRGLGGQPIDDQNFRTFKHDTLEQYL